MYGETDPEANHPQIWQRPESGATGITINSSNNDDEREQTRDSSRPSTKKSSKSSRPAGSSDRSNGGMSDLQRGGIASDAIDPLTESLKNLKLLLLRKHKEAQFDENVVKSKMCLDAIKHLDKGEREIRELEDPYVEAVSYGKVFEAEALRTEMVDIKAAAMHAGHLELLLDKSEASTLDRGKSRDRNDSSPDDKRYRKRDSAKRRSTPTRGSSETRYRREKTPTRERGGQELRHDHKYNEHRDQFYHRRKYAEKGSVYYNARPHDPEQGQMLYSEHQPQQNPQAQQQMYNYNPPPQPFMQQPTHEVSDQKPTPSGPTCPFCDETNEEFESKKRLNKHYADYCPMLHRCGYCNRATEVRRLNAHYLSKCPFLTDSMRACPKCAQACSQDEYEKHEQDFGNQISINTGRLDQNRVCPAVAPGPGQGWCRLCDQIVNDTEIDWKAHLIGVMGCNGNLRRMTQGAGPPPKKISAYEMMMNMQDQSKKKKKSKKSS